MTRQRQRYGRRGGIQPFSAIDAGLKLLRSATSWYSAKDITDADQQSLPNRNGAGEAQRGSTTGSDTNDPVLLPHDGEDYVWLPGTTGNHVSTTTSTPGTGAVLITARIPEGIQAGPTSYVCPISAGSSSSNVVMAYFRGTSDFFRLFVRGVGNTVYDTTDQALPGGMTRDQIRWIRLLYDPTTDTLLFELSTTDTTVLSDVVWVTALTEVGTVGITSFGTMSARIGNNPYSDSAAPFIGPVSQATAVMGVDTKTLTPGSPGLTIARSTSGLKTTVVTSPVAVFDGTDDYIQLPDSDTPTFTATTGKHTVVAAVRVHDTASRWVFSSETDTDDGMILWHSNGVAYFRIGGDSSVGTSGQSGMTNGELVVIAGVVDDGTRRAYVHGVGFGSTSSTTAVGTISHGTPRLGTRGFETSQGYRNELFSVASFPGEAKTEEELDAIATRLLKEHS